MPDHSVEIPTPRVTSQPVATDISTVKMAQWIDIPRNVLTVSAIQTPAMETTVEAATT